MPRPAIVSHSKHDSHTLAFRSGTASDFRLGSHIVVGPMLVCLGSDIAVGPMLVGLGANIGLPNIPTAQPVCGPFRPHLGRHGQNFDFCP